MHYLSLFPSLIAALYLSVHDVRTRTVPRRAVLLALATQTVVFAGLISWRTAFPLHSLEIPTDWTWTHLAVALLLALVCGLIQLTLALIRPGSLGMGDVTATVLLTAGISMYGGFLGVCLWWLMLGICGCASLALTAARKAPRRAEWTIAFVPVLATATLLAHLVYWRAQT
jgi:leader peptidase (prepilin peptidase)/N-methyltransferase